MKKVLLLFAVVASTGIAVAGLLDYADRPGVLLQTLGESYNLTLNSGNGKVTSLSSVETQGTARTVSGADFSFHHKGLTSYASGFARFNANGYLVTHSGINGLRSVSAVASDSLYVSFAYSDRAASGDWTRPVELSTTVDAPSGMHYVKIETYSAVNVTSITFNYDCSGVESPTQDIRIYAHQSEYTKIYSWTNQADEIGPWPGQDLGAPNEGGWRSYLFADHDHVEFKFSAPTETENLRVDGYGDHYYYNGRYYGYNPLDPQYVYTFFVKKSCDYQRIYLWDDQGNKKAGNWPGAAMNVYDDTYYWYTYESTDPINVIFNGGAGQTDDIHLDHPGIYKYDSSSIQPIDVSSESSSQPTPSSEPVSSAPVSSEPAQSSSEAQHVFTSPLYFTNSQGWSTVYAYAWSAEGTNAAWPGVEMHYHRVNEYSQGVYSISGLDSYNYVIFNNGSGAQTVDIPASGLGNNNAYFLDGTQDGSGHYNVGCWTENQQEDDPDPNANKGLKILHCFDWSLANIQANLDDIAAQGFNAVQTSPLQANKDYNWAYNDDNNSWWRFYQPVSLSIGNSTTNVLFSTSNGHNDLQALTSAASSRGIRVIVDIVANHLGDDGHGNLHSNVGQFESYIYNNGGQTLHNYGSCNDDSIRAIVQGDQTGKDLNTGNSHVQERVRDYLKSLIDDGVTGFRFDAAKHIETPDEEEYASNFWTETLGAARSYATSKHMPLFAYGEVINPSGKTGKRGYTQYVYSAGLDAVTDTNLSGSHRGGNHSDTYFYTGLSAEHNVVWGESHDDYCGSGHTTTYTDQSVINDAYNSLARTNHDDALLYFARPDFSAKIGNIDAHPDWGWRCDYIKQANLAH